MQEEIATVVSNQNGVVEVTTKIQSTCGKCEQSSHCGTGLLARYLAPKPDNLTLSTELDVLPGQQVKIGFSESVLLKLAALIYLMPIVILMVSASLIALFLPSLPELLLILTSFTCCGLYFFGIKSLIESGRLKLGEPEVIQVFSAEETPIKMHFPPK